MPYLCKCNQLFYGQHIAILWLVIITECNARAQITENASSSSKGDDGSTNTKHWFKVFHLHWGSLHFQKKKKKIDGYRCSTNLQHRLCFWFPHAGCSSSHLRASAASGLGVGWRWEWGIRCESSLFRTWLEVCLGLWSLDISAPIAEPHRNPRWRRPIKSRASALQRQEQSREEDGKSSGGMDGKGMGMGRYAGRGTAVYQTDGWSNHRHRRRRSREHEDDRIQIPPRSEQPTWARRAVRNNADTAHIWWRSGMVAWVSTRQKRRRGRVWAEKGGIWTRAASGSAGTCGRVRKFLGEKKLGARWSFLRENSCFRYQVCQEMLWAHT